MYEVVMKSKKTGRIWNGFYSTLKDARKRYFDWRNAGFEGDIYQRDEE